MEFQAPTMIKDTVVCSDLSHTNTFTRKLYIYDSWIFDLDGTLVKSLGPISVLLAKKINKQHNFSVSPEQIRSHMGSSIEKILESLGVQASYHKNLIEEFRNDLKKSIPKYHPPIQSALRLLELLKQTGIKVGVATNKPTAIAEQVIQETDLKHYVDVVVGSTGLCPKPDTSILEKCIEDLKATRPIMVGDSEEDKIAALNLNVPYIGIKREKKPNQIEGTDREIALQSMGQLLTLYSESH
jgi:phosphoglycolate phosphatase